MSQDTLVLSDMLKLRQKSFEPLLFETISLPPQLIPNSFIAFGGYTIAVAIQAAFHSLQGDEMDQDQWSIYSIAGLFLGPTMLDSKLQYHVDIIRHTRSFQTRFITATQSNKGQDRKCLCVAIDFTRKMPSSGPPHSESRLPLCYTLSPHHSYPKVDDIKLFIDDITQRVSEGKVSSSTKKKYVAAWGRFLDIIDLKLIPGDVTYETLMGIVPLKVSGIKTRQQQEIADITKRRCSDYFRAKEKIKSVRSTSDDFLPMTFRSIQASFSSIAADGPIGDFPVMEHNLGRLDAGSLSTMDFSIRFHDDDYDFNQYHLREMRTYCAERQRTFGEALFFNLDGKLIASSTQQCTCWPKKEKTRL